MKESLNKFARLFENQEEATSDVTRMLLALGILACFILIERALSTFVARMKDSSFRGGMIRALHRPLSVFLVVLGTHSGLRVIDLPETSHFRLRESLDQAFSMAVVILMVWALYRMAAAVSKGVIQMLGTKDPLIERQFLPLLTRTLRIVTIIMGVLLILQNMGYSIASLLTGLGIGGLAVALAAQETLSNIFSSVMLLTDMPFRVGDVIAFKSIEGTVESIGFRTTRIRSPQGSLLVIPNKLLTNDTIENLSARDQRRIRIVLTIAVETPAARIKDLVASIEKVFRSHARIVKDSVLVHLIEMVDGLPQIQVLCDTPETQIGSYNALHQEMLAGVLDLAQKMNVQLATHFNAKR